MHRSYFSDFRTQWGRSGFDGDVEAREAGRSGICVKIPNLKLKANNNVAYAA